MSYRYFAIIIIILLINSQVYAAVQTLYVDDNGSGSDCSEGSPCTVATALSTVADGDGDTIIFNSGTYSSFNLDDATDHDNLTITSTAAIISILGTFTRGIPDGSDNRPVIGGIYTATGVTGVTIQYLDINGGGVSSGYNAPVWFESPGNAIQYCEIHECAHGIIIETNREIIVNHCYIHHAGTMDTVNDDHGVAIANYSGDAVASGWSEAIVIQNSTFAYIGGDGVQENSEAYAQTDDDPPFRYLKIINNDFLGPFDEQCLDFKGTQYVWIEGNKMTGTGYNGDAYAIAIHSTYGSGEVSDNFWIFNNNIYGNNYQAIRASGAGTNWHTWNNWIYENGSSPGYTGNVPIVNLPSGSWFVHNFVWNNNTDPDSGSYSISGIQPNGDGDKIVNNIFYNNGTGTSDYGNIRAYGGEDTGTPSYNYVYPTGCDGSYCQTGTNAITSSDPGITDLVYPTYDFSLIITSVCRNAGTDLVDSGDFTPDTDRNDVARDSSPDLGTAEYSAGSPSTPTITGLSVQ